MAHQPCKTVLIVEDSPTQALALQLLLESEGLNVEVATNGKQGVKRALLLRPAAIVMDLEMPDMNGYEAMTLIHGDYRTDTIPIIILTCHNRKNEPVKTIRLGAVDFVLKDDEAEIHILEVLRRLGVLGGSNHP